MRKINIYLSKIIIFFTMLAICILLLIYLKSKASSPFTPLLGGLITGLIVALLQLLLMWTEHNEMERLKKLSIKTVLAYRDEEELYKKVIEKSKKEIRVLGNTASRFMNDFADETRIDKRALIDALNRNVHVKFLLPDQNSLWNPDDKDRARISLRAIQDLKGKYGNLVECRFYSHSPFHSLVLADNDCFVGPIFPNRKSKDTPTIYTDTSSVFAESYLNYFDFEWKNAQPCP
jgi:hypothetical protein